MVIEMMVRFVEVHSILVLVRWFCLGQDGVVLIVERASEPAKHVHDAVFISMRSAMLGSSDAEVASRGHSDSGYARKGITYSL